MAKYSSTRQPSIETQEEAIKIARSTQQPGQTKEQTKLIAQGIQKGIQQYKKQYKTKSRELDKKSRKVADRQQAAESAMPAKEVTRYKQHWLPWALLIITWLGIAAFLYFFRYNP